MPRSGLPKMQGKRVASKKPSLGLRPGRQPERELRRITLRHLEWALGELRKRPLSAEAVHQVRTSIKKIRALLELADPSLDPSDRSSLKRKLGTAAAILSPLRDAEVLLETLADLMETQGLSGTDLSILKSSLSANIARRRLSVQRCLPLMVHALEEALVTVSDWKPRQLRRADLRESLQRTYRRGRKALKRSAADNNPELFHAWRKRAKELWYQLRITEELLSPQAQSLITMADHIGELAGKERDYSLLADALRKQGSQKGAALEKSIPEILSDLRKRAEQAGTLLYARKPERFLAATGL